MNLSDLQTFILVAEGSSIKGAAERLGVPKSTVSRRVRRLEDELGLNLLMRTARSVRLTSPGERLFQRCRPALMEIDEVERGLADVDSAPRGLLRVTASADAGRLPNFVDFLCRFTDTYPEIHIELELTNRFVDLISEGFDIAFRPHVAPLSNTTSLMTKRLGAATICLFASSAYLEARGRPRRPDDLATHDLLTHAMPRLRETWSLEHRKKTATVAVARRARLVANDFSVLAGAAEKNQGIAILPNFFRNWGALEPVLPSWQLTQGSLSLIWPVSRYEAPRVRAMIDFASAQPWLA